MYRRLAAQLIVISIIFRFLFVVICVFPIALLGAFVLYSSNSAWPVNGLLIFIAMICILGGMSGILLGLDGDIRTIKRLKKIRQVADSFLGDERETITSYIESSADKMRQIRVTRGDTPRIEHYHLEIKGGKGEVIENYICGNKETLAEVFRYVGRTRKDRFFSNVGHLIGEKISVKHLMGLPPDLSEKITQTIECPLPDFLLIEKWHNGFYLYRMTKSLEYCGDTWHESLQEAKQQAEYEYGLSNLTWDHIPLNINDGISYLLEQNYGERA